MVEVSVFQFRCSSLGDRVSGSVGPRWVSPIGSTKFVGTKYGVGDRPSQIHARCSLSRDLSAVLVIYNNLDLLVDPLTYLGAKC